MILVEWVQSTPYRRVRTLAQPLRDKSGYTTFFAPVRPGEIPKISAGQPCFANALCDMETA
ncbi:hypothetical protein SuNHUV7_07600 (plasmid) [Pseudoseohaeicola sp. NH-UV-7]